MSHYISSSEREELMTHLLREAGPSVRKQALLAGTGIATLYRWRGHGRIPRSTAERVWERIGGRPAARRLVVRNPSHRSLLRAARLSHGDPVAALALLGRCASMLQVRCVDSGTAVETRLTPGPPLAVISASRGDTTRTVVLAVRNRTINYQLFEDGASGRTFAGCGILTKRGEAFCKDFLSRISGVRQTAIPRAFRPDSQLAQ